MDTIEQPAAEIHTERLLLRPMARAHHEALLALWRDPKVRRYLWDNRIISPEEVTAIQQASDACAATHGAGLYVIELQRAPERLIGFCGFREFENGEYPELLYGIYPEYWGHGVVSEAARTLLQHGFEACGFEQVIAATDTPNQPSVQVMQRLGMGFAERKLWHNLDTVFYTLSRVDYQSL